MWYEGVPAGNTSRVGYATSSDGIAWTKYGGTPIMVPTEAWEGAPAGETSPTTVLKEDGLYKMWYHGYQNGTRRIGYATSIDGLTWTKYGGNPILAPGPSGAWDADSIAEPHVIKVGSTYFMYYMHALGVHGVGLATSPDGVRWTKGVGNPVLQKGPAGAWDDASLQVGGVIYDDRMFHIWFRAPVHGSWAGIGYASSNDGVTWTKSANNPLLLRPNPPLGKGDDYGVAANTNVFRRGGQWWIYYGGFVFCCPEDMGVNLAFSTVKTAPNMAPTVDAGADQTITLPATATLSGTVMDDDVPVPLENVKTTWSRVTGPDAVTFAGTAGLVTTASFSQPGTYVLRLTADDGQLSASDDVTVSVLGVPPTATATQPTPPTLMATMTRTQTPTITTFLTPTMVVDRSADMNCDTSVTAADVTALINVTSSVPPMPCAADRFDRRDEITLVIDAAFKT
jgi:predicted GH43/DUF377 family glycosyl hydrolase